MDRQPPSAAFLDMSTFVENIRALKPRTRWTIFAGVATIALIVTALLKPIPQPQYYHHFADTRTLFGLANAGDVLSNLPFLAVGAVGLYFALRKKSALTQDHSTQDHLTQDRLNKDRLNKDQQWAYATMFAGLVLTCFGSAYYHLAPDNSRLVWDRLPMTVAMAGLIGALLTDRFGAKSVRIMPLIAAIGIGTVIQWGLSEEHGNGDLRWYAFYQGMVMITAVAMLVLFRSQREGTREFVIAAIANFAAKMFELADKPIFALGGVVSGHTLKHLSAGLGFIPLVLLLAQTGKQRTTEDAEERRESV